MRIWTQNLIAVLPVFVALALALGIVFYGLERSNLIQGARDEATSEALTIAEFDAQERADSSTSSVAGAPPSMLVKPLATIRRYGPALDIVELRSEGDAVVWAYPQPPSSPVAQDLASTRHLTALLRKTGTYASGLQSSPRGPVIRAYARTSLPEPGGAPIIGIEIRGDGIVRSLNATLFLIAKLTAGVLGLGISVVLLTSLLITKELRTLSAAAAKVAGGDLDVEARPGRIQEIGDLGNTFNTMSAVLSDVIDKTRRSLIEGEQFRGDAELADTYANLFRPPLDSVIDGVRFVGGAVGDRGIGAIWLVAQMEAGPCAIIGHVAEIDPLEASVTASAATRLIQDLLPLKGIEATLAEAAGLFTFSDLICLQVRHGDAGGPLALDTCRCSSSEPDAVLESRPNTLPHAFHTLGPDADPIIERYMSLFVDVPVDQLFADLVPALPPDVRGVLVLAGSRAEG